MSAATIARSAGGILLFVLAAGCGGDEKYATAPVSGKVTLNGAPLANATVIFQPSASGNPGPPSSGETDDKGEFTLAFNDGNEGAVVGPHTVLITTRRLKPGAATSDTAEDATPEQVPANYRTDPLKFTVPKEGSDKANFELAGTPADGAAQGARPANIRND